jgi:hypothetical protein
MAETPSLAARGGVSRVKPGQGRSPDAPAMRLLDAWNGERVGSTDEQSLTLELDALNGARCEEIFQDIGSGADNSRFGGPGALSVRWRSHGTMGLRRGKRL